MRKNHSELVTQLETFSRDFPRGLDLSVSNPIGVMDVEASWPNANLPGVYAFFDADMTLLYIGKASCMTVLGKRLGQYFYADGALRTKMEKFADTRFVCTIAVPSDRAFEAPSIEEYLIYSLNPELNQNCQNLKLIGNELIEKIKKAETSD